MKVDYRSLTIDDYSATSELSFQIEQDLFAFKSLKGQLFGAFSDKKLIAFLRLDPIWDRIPYIGLIWVQLDFRKKGVGKGLLRFVENTLTRKGYDYLISSSQSNEPKPQHWHKKMGFTEIGTLYKLNDDGSREIFYRKPIQKH